MTDDLPPDSGDPGPLASAPTPNHDLERPLDDPRALQILTAEHAALSSARSRVYNEAFTRAGMFLTFLSASLVALALVGQAMAFSREFLVLAATLLVFDTFIGVATVGRILEAQIADLRFIHGVNRIRAGYAGILETVLGFEAEISGPSRRHPEGRGQDDRAARRAPSAALGWRHGTTGDAAHPTGVAARRGAPHPGGRRLAASGPRRQPAER